MRSIELSWIARFDKSLPLPAIVFGSDDNFSGLYYPPHKSDELIGDGYHDRSNGIIFISTNFWWETAQNIAHEWRHHWQVFHGWNITPSFYWNSPSNYDAAIVAYFTKSTSEADALRFQTRHAGCCDYWKSLLSPTGFVFS
jgi:hypothetical protein